MSKKPANSNNDYNKNNNKTSFTPEKNPQKQTKAGETSLMNFNEGVKKCISVSKGPPGGW